MVLFSRILLKFEDFYWSGKFLFLHIHNYHNLDAEGSKGIVTYIIFDLYATIQRNILNQKSFILKYGCANLLLICFELFTIWTDEI